MRSEIQALEDNDTWELTELPSDKKALGSRWIYKIKYHADGSVERLKARLVVFSAAALLACATVYAADVKLEGIKCPVSGKAVKAASSVDYKGGKVYFCCDNCPDAFKKDMSKFATKANVQLFATGQAKEVKCPITGKDLNPATAIEVGGAKVAFCCNNCKGKVSKAEGDEQLNLVFGEEAFKKGFEVKKTE